MRWTILARSSGDHRGDGHGSPLHTKGHAGGRFQEVPRLTACSRASFWEALVPPTRGLHVLRGTWGGTHSRSLAESPPHSSETSGGPEPLPVKTLTYHLGNGLLILGHDFPVRSETGWY